MSFTFESSSGRPRALLLMDPDEVPPDLREELDTLVAPTWQAAGALAPADAEVLVTANMDLNAACLAKLPGLRLIVTTGTAYDYVALDYCEAHEIAVCNTPGYTGSSVAEHAFALLLATNRRICALDSGVRDHVADTSVHLGQELEGKTAGVVGLGDIGTRIARLAQGYGMQVQFVNRSAKDLPGATQVDLPTLLCAADAVFLSLPLTGQTRHLLGADQFKLMKSAAYVINISADELIDPAALADALRSGAIAGAGLDVIGSPDPFLDLPNTVLTPAHGWYTAEGVYRRAATWVATIRSALDGRPTHRIV